MRLRELFEDGRIVKGVNTTADVSPNEIKIQAAKFGNTVDKDGKPPLLSKKVKGSSTNVLFNLGLTESRIQQLEASYEGNIGIMELMKFFQTAPSDLVDKVKDLVKQKRDKEVWKIVQSYTGTKLKGKEFDENFTDGKKLVVFDIDDTLVYTQTKIHVVKDGRIIVSLNSHDFTHYKLQPGEEFDFGDFRNAKEFFDNSKPNIPMMNQLKRDINTGNKVVMVTARADFDDRDLFLDTFRKFGIDMSKVHVYRAGNSKQGTTEERKKAIIKNLLDKEEYSKAIMYDDAKPNLHTFMELKKDHPRTRFYAWHVSLDGNATEYMREQIEENFADGKKPGRKGLAKRSGVNCKQSVTKLRKIAKNSSGERQRMAHWCANMKGGKK
jgi:hypothetical protein